MRNLNTVPVNSTTITYRTTCAAVTNATSMCSTFAVIDISAMPPGAAARRPLPTYTPQAQESAQPTSAAQVLLGCALGARFDRDFVASAPGLLLAFVPSIAVMVGLAAFVGWLISVTSGAYLGTALLSAAPGGIAEMSITAKVLRIGVAFVTAAHVVRYLVVVIFTIPMYRVLEKVRLRVGR